MFYVCRKGIKIHTNTHTQSNTLTCTHTRSDRTKHVGVHEYNCCQKKSCSYFECTFYCRVVNETLAIKWGLRKLKLLHTKKGSKRIKYQREIERKWRESVCVDGIIGSSARRAIIHFTPCSQKLKRNNKPRNTCTHFQVLWHLQKYRDHNLSSSKWHRSYYSFHAMMFFFSIPHRIRQSKAKRSGTWNYIPRQW